MFREYLYGLRDSLTIVVGYIPVAVVFGLSAIASGFTFFETIITSMLIFAGMSQFILINMINISPIYAIILASLVNLRHIVYGYALSRKCSISKKILVAFGLTDEVYALSICREKLTEHYIIGLITGAYTSWVSGTVLGTLIGNVLLKIMFISNLKFILIALFISILVLYIENVKDIILILLISSLSAILYMFNIGEISPLISPIIALILEKIYKCRTI